MRLAWVTPYLPEPAASGGAIRQQRLARALAEHAQLHLFARAEWWERPRLGRPELSLFAKRWAGCDYLPQLVVASDQDSTIVTRSRRVRRGSPCALWRALRSAHQQAPFDGIVVSHSWGAYGAFELDLPVIVDEHNIESNFFAALGGPRLRAAAPFATEISEMQRWERALWARAALVTCVSADDASIISTYRCDCASPGAGSRPAVVIENGTDVPRFAYRPWYLRNGGALFIGSLRHRPNVDAAQRLISRIMPLVWSRLPALTLTIVGGPVPKDISQLARLAAGRVEVAGRVPDVACYLANHRLFVNPVMCGAGSSLKTLEPLASGMPLISSACGVRGLPLEAG